MEPRAGASPKGKVFTGAKSRKLRREDRKTPEPKTSHIRQRVPSCLWAEAISGLCKEDQSSVT
ncbi:hypothetical protein Bca52824_071413 [Brassica carinata]|uniref:Uncharacterized protein n=1 Tax=Brassica carinata TaxID=52824 RepID=A0A8X7Q5S1_BRACI|nr:hypothetical protein Bca52824_071413 [Brassica carinata]